MLSDYVRKKGSTSRTLRPQRQEPAEDAPDVTLQQPLPLPRQTLLQRILRAVRPRP